MYDTVTWTCCLSPPPQVSALHCGEAQDKNLKGELAALSKRHHQVCQQKLLHIQPVTLGKGHVRLQSKFLSDKNL